ncbi:MAG: glycosyltransferase [Ferruginibacter sp.]|nr:glycosyltransferase [Ferruginibacter sp.]
MAKKYSIILPVYNGGQHVKECVNSILCQTYAEFDLLVLDNHSNDGTSEWLDSLKDSRISIYRTSAVLPIEQNWARISMIRKNEFMTMIGHDDILLPNYLKEMNCLIKKHPDASLYQTHFSFIDEFGHFKSHCKPMSEIQSGHEFLASQFTGTIDSTGTGYLMRSADYDELGGISSNYVNLIYADYQLWLQLSLKKYKATSEKSCFRYRVHDSVSKLTDGEKFQAAFGIYVHFLTALCKKDGKVNAVVKYYGYDMLMTVCESLAHRILKIPRKLRKITVKEHINKFRRHASELIPGQEFEPLSKFKIKIALLLDQNIVGRTLFCVYKKIF